MQQDNTAGPSPTGAESTAEGLGLLAHYQTLRRKVDRLREQSEELLEASWQDQEALRQALSAASRQPLIEVETLRRAIEAGSRHRPTASPAGHP